MVFLKLNLERLVKYGPFRLPDETRLSQIQGKLQLKYVFICMRKEMLLN